MSIIRIFPKKDTTIYTEYPKLNSGIDAILDLSKNESLTNASYSAASRILVEFDQNEILAFVSDFVNGQNISSSLGLYLANASDIPVDYTLEVFPLSESWDMGTGRFINSPITTNGASWIYKNVDLTTWQSSSFSPNITASFTSDNPGGGNWYYNYKATESFDNRSKKDVYIDVSSTVNAWINNDIDNNGFIIKNNDAVEFDSNINYTLMYFSVDTNTIYPPYLDLKWDDSSYVTGSMPMIPSNNIVLSLSNNPGIFDIDAISTLRVRAREQYPQRTFVTSSIYATGNYLPETSYWRLRDVDTDIIVIDFDKDFTKLSADTESNYFKLYMGGLEPERYYRIEIKVDYLGQSNIFKDDYYFKIKQ